MMQNIKNLVNRFDKYAAFRTFVGRKSERVMDKFITQAGVENICKAIEAGVMVTDKIPMKDKMTWRAQLEPYAGLFHIFTDQDLYNWIPKRYREYFEKKYGPIYAKYMAKQCQVIREFLTY